MAVCVKQLYKGVCAAAATTCRETYDEVKEAVSTLKFEEFGEDYRIIIKLRVPLSEANDFVNQMQAKYKLAEKKVSKLKMAFETSRSTVTVQEYFQMSPAYSARLVLVIAVREGDNVGFMFSDYHIKFREMHNDKYMAHRSSDSSRYTAKLDQISTLKLNKFFKVRAMMRFQNLSDEAKTKKIKNEDDLIQIKHHKTRLIDC